MNLSVTGIMDGFLTLSPSSAGGDERKAAAPGPGCVCDVCHPEGVQEEPRGGLALIPPYGNLERKDQVTCDDRAGPYGLTLYPP